MSDKNCEHEFEYEESGLFTPAAGPRPFGRQADNAANRPTVSPSSQMRTQTRWCKKCGKQETRKQKVVWDEWQPLPDMIIDE